jgi:DNA-directed RNA polymerase specialized sigma24 family protein
MAATHDTGGASFPTTRPSFVAGLGAQEGAARAHATEVFVRSYWRPVYGYVRLRLRRASSEAEDLTQGFFAWALEHGWLGRFDPARGRFRTFVRLSLDGFVANERAAERRAKRGGGRAPLALDFETAEGELAGREPPAEDSVAVWFDAEWRREFLRAVLAEVEALLAHHGDGLRARIFRAYDLVEPPAERPTYAELGRRLGCDETTVTNHLAAARRLFRERLLERLREETADEEEFRLELAELLGGRA